MRCFFLSWFAVIGYTAVMVYEPMQTGYSQSDVAGMNKLINREIKSVPHRKVWTGKERRLALQELGLEVSGK